MGEARAAMQYLLELWNEWEIQVVVVASFSLQVILFFFAGIRRSNISFVVKALLWLVYLLADVIATYALGHMSSSLSKKSSGEHQLVALWAPFLVLHLGGQDTITAYALEDNRLWLRHLLNMFVQVAGTAYVLYKYINTGEGAFVRAAMLVLAAGVVKYGERIWALKLASNGGPPSPCTPFPLQMYDYFHNYPPRTSRQRQEKLRREEWHRQNGGDRFTKNKKFRAYAFIVMTAHLLRHVLVKPVIIDRNKASIFWHSKTIGLVKDLVQGCPWQDDWSEDASAKEKKTIGELYKGVEVQLGLMYDMLYTKAEVIHKSRGHSIRAISLVCCFTALVAFTKSKRDGYSTPNIVITFVLLGGACALEVTSLFKAIGSTWTYDILRSYRCKWLANAILFARYYLVVVKDGRWSNSAGQFNFISFRVQSKKNSLKLKWLIAHWIGVKDWWDRARCTKHVKLSPALKEFVWGVLKGEWSHMVQIEDVIKSGYWARKFSGIDQIKQLDWSMSLEFHESVLLWHIATDIFLNNPADELKLVGKDKDMAESVNTLSDYMMYLLVKHPDLLPVKADTRSFFHQASCSLQLFDAQSYHEVILSYKERASDEAGNPFDGSGEAVLVKACSIAHTMLDMELGLAMAIIGTVWMEMLCYAATNATEGFHARQLSNGGEFLTHILLLSKYATLDDIEAEEAIKASVPYHCKEEITETP